MVPADTGAAMRRRGAAGVVPKRRADVRARGEPEPPPLTHTRIHRPMYGLYILMLARRTVRATSGLEHPESRNP